MAKISNLFSYPIGSIDQITFTKIRRTGIAKKKISKNTSNTPQQQKIRSAFSVAVKLVQPMNAVIRQGFRLYTKTMSAYNSCMQYSLKNVVTHDFQIDYQKVMISRGGSLFPVENANTQIDDQSIIITWKDNSNETGRSNPTDKSLICVFNENNSEVTFNADGNERNAETQVIALPLHWQTGDKLHTHIGFASTTNNNVSNSLYIGQAIMP